MKVLFAINNEETAKQIAEFYKSTYGEKIEYTKVYFFRSLIETLRKNKNFDRIIIHEELEAVSVKNQDVIDKFLFTNIDKVSDEAGRADIIFICSERRQANDKLLKNIFNLGIYNILIGPERTVGKACELINKPRTKKDAKRFLEVDIEEDPYESTEKVDEIELRNIVSYYDRNINDKGKIIEGFESLYNQYTFEKLKQIAPFLPARARDILSKESQKYIALMSYENQKPGKHRGEEKVRVVEVPIYVQETPKIDESPRISKVEPSPQVAPMFKMPVDEEKTVDVEPEEEKHEPKVEPVVEVPKIEPKVEPVVEVPKIEPKVESVVEAPKIEPKVEPVVEAPKIEPKVEPVVEVPKIEPKVEPVVEVPKIEPKVEPVVEAPKIEPKVEPLVEAPKIEPKVEPVVEAPKIEPKVEPVIEAPKVEPKVEPVVEAPKIEPKVEPVVEAPKIEPKVEPVVEAPKIEPKVEPVTEQEPKLIRPTKYTPGSTFHAEEQPFTPTQNNPPAVEQPNVAPRYQSPRPPVVEPMIQTVRQVIEKEVIKEVYETPKDYKKAVCFIGAHKSGSTFIINAIANVLASKGVKTAILDLTKNKDTYLMYAGSDSDNKEIAGNSLNNLAIGQNKPLELGNLSVYTGIPRSDRTKYDAYKIIETVKRENSVVLIDCDFVTPIEVFRYAQTIYVVQDMDALNVLPITMFLKELKTHEIDLAKVSVIINKYIKCSLTATRIVDVLSYYTNPEMTIVEDLLPKSVRRFIVPFDEQNYLRYIENLYSSKMNFSGFSEEFKQAIAAVIQDVFPIGMRGAPKPQQEESGFIKNIFKKR